MIQTDIDYPETLPCPLREGYAAKTVQPFQRTNLVSGRARQRRRFSSTPTEYRVSWMFANDAEAAEFETWFKYTLNSGASWFNMPMLTPAGGYARQVCRFVDMYDGPDPVAGTMWRVSAKLEMWEQPVNQLEP